MTPIPSADLLEERKLVARNGSNFLVAGMDEVGRGALAGVVSVGCVVVDPFEVEALDGITDSKVLNVKAREAFVKPIQSWAMRTSVGHATPGEIDRWGISVALRLAGHRALRDATSSLDRPVVVLLDGNFDWLTPSLDLFSVEYESELLPQCPPIQTVLKGDLRCATVAAASVLAKVERDNLLTSLDADFPHYGWKQNKGYGSLAHRSAIQVFGPSPFHRITWLTKILDDSKGTAV